MKKQPFEFLGDELRLISYCPICNEQCNSMEVRVLSEDEETKLLHVQCQKCRNSMLALVLTNHAGASSIGLLTDLSYEDVLKFYTNKQVTINDVISVHEWLEDPTSNF